MKNNKNSDLYLMCIYLCVVLLKCTNCMNDYDFNEKIKEYLSEKAQYIQENLLNRRTRAISHEELSTVNFEKFRTIYNFPNTENNTTTKQLFFTLFNKNYALINNEAFQISKLQNGSATIEKLDNFIKFRSYVTFLKAAEFDELGLILIGLKSGEIEIFSTDKNKNNFEFVQSFGNGSVNDAIFFENQNKLHLIISVNFGGNVAKNLIFSWSSTFFHLIDTIYSNHVASLVSFSCKNSEIIIFLQPSSKTTQSNPQVFKFENDNLKKHQQLNSNYNSTHAAVFKAENETYVTILNGGETHETYWWNGEHLLHWNIFTSKSPVVRKSFVTYQKKLPLLLTVENNKLMAYKATAEGISFISETSRDYFKILDVFADGFSIFVIANNKNHAIIIEQLNIEVDKITTPQENSNQTLLQCLKSLDEKLNAQKEELRVFKKKKLVDEPVFENFARSGSGVSAQKFIDSQIRNPMEELNLILSDTKERLETLHPVVDNYTATPEHLIIGGNVLIEGSIFTEQLDSKTVYLKSLNGHNWTPEQWLSYTKPQTISGPVTADMVITKQLEITEEDNIFKNVLLNRGPQTISGFLKLASLETNEMYTPSINGIPFEDFYLKSQPVVRGTKNFNHLETNNLLTENINQRNTEEILNFLNGSSEFNYDIGDNLYIDNLIVEDIDGINFNEFKNSVFRIGITDTITGNLVFSEVHTDTLKVNTLNGFQVKDFLTLTTNQTIDADVEFNNVFANKEVILNTVNDVSLSKDVARIVEGADIFIESPVRMDKLTTKDLELKDGADESLYMKKGSHIIGTNESDFLQIYSGTVKIKGNLHLKDLNVDKFALGDEEQTGNLLRKFWTRSTIQRIPRHVEFLKGMEIKSLTANKLNNIPFEDFMINNGEPKKPTVFNFENVTVNGNVILNREEENVPNLEKINNEAVKKTGTYEIFGRKIFKNALKVDDLVTETLNKIVVDEAVKTKLPEDGSFKNLIINGDLIASNVSLKILNNIDVKEFVKTTVYVKDNPEKINNLDFGSLKVENLNIVNLNEKSVDEYIKKKNQFLNMNKIKNVYVTGNVKIEEAKNVSKINNQAIEDLLDDPQEEKETVRFLGKFFVKDLFAENINDVHFQNLTKRILYKRWNQEVTAHYNFKQLITSDLETSKIGTVQVDDLIDVAAKDTQTIIAPKGVRFVAKTVATFLQSDGLPCNIHEGVDFIWNPSGKTWENVVVNGNVTLMDPDTKLNKILSKAVIIDADNVITEPVTFTSDVFAKTVNVEKTINNVNVFELLEDALLKDGSNEQIVKGRNVFRNLDTSSARVFNNTDAPIINEFLIEAINESITNQNDLDGKIITGTKTFFGGLQTKHFNAKSVSNVLVENIVDISSNKPVPKVLFDKLYINKNLKINQVNNIDLNNFLNNRLLLNDSDPQVIFATYFFENVEFFDDVKVSEINKIKIEDVVFDEGLQVIPSSKKFLNEVIFENNIQVETINEIPLSEYYEKVLLSGENSTIDGDVEILQPSEVNANIRTETINGFDIKNLEEIMHEDSTTLESSQIKKVVKRIERMLHESLDMVKSMPNEYMYIEKTKEFQISVPNTMSAQAVDMNGQILIHLTGQESGHMCGLPDSCPCPMQQTMQISSEQSLNDFYNKGSQRIFTFNDDNVTMHFITNSVSISKNCRAEKNSVSNEMSSLTWNSKTVGNGSFILYPKHFSGYISGADSFSINGQSYLLIGRYYDPVNDSYNLDCILIRLSHDKSSAEIIQKIPTNGVWTLHLFHTAQGVTLVLGNVGNFSQTENTNTQIFRFNTETQQFKLLKTIPNYGATSAAGVAFESDSLIVLARKQQPLQILKYEPFYDNYFFFQSFQLNAPVIGMSTFYTGDVGITQAHLAIVTENSNYYIYTYRYVEGWILVTSGHLEGLKNLIPFNLNKQAYLFAPSKHISSLFTIVKFGSN